MRLVTILTAMVLALGLCTAATATMMNSANWEGSYEGNADPTTEGWGTVGSPVPNVGGGLLVLGENSASWDGYKYSVPDTSALSIEYRAYITPGAGNYSFYSDMPTNSTGESGLQLRHAPNVTNSVGSNNIDGQIVYGIDTTVFHIYRRTMVDNGNDTVTGSLYIDDDPTPVATVTNGRYNYAGQSQVNLYPGNATGYFHLDYVRWTTQGAFPPVPEPASMVLLLGGLGALLRRRR